MYRHTLHLLLFLFLITPSDSDCFTGKSSANLYHDHDALDCSDCHAGNTGLYDGTPEGGSVSMLKRPTTDLCLSCHAESAADRVEAPYAKTSDGKNPGIKGRAMPAGDFFFSSLDSRKGHNPGKTGGRQSSSMPSDQKLTVAPGGEFSTQNWDCCSCHEPHYRFAPEAAAWRQLKRKVNGIIHTGNETALVGVESDGGNQGSTAVGFKPIESNSRGDTDGVNVIAARKDNAPLDGANLFLAEGETNKNVYLGGFSSFCATCHGEFHNSTSGAASAAAGEGAWTRHPTDLALAATATYTAGTYTKAVTNVQGTSPNPAGYDWKYPLARVNGSWSVTSPSIPGQIASGDRIMCLTCHKAHASQFDNMLRWDVRKPGFIASGKVDGYHESSNGDNPAYGCNKCHLIGGAKAYVKTF